MSDVRTCPNCGAKAKYQIKEDVETLTAIQDQDAFKKIGQLKNAMEKFKAKAEALEKELNELKNK